MAEERRKGSGAASAASYLRASSDDHRKLPPPTAAAPPAAGAPPSKKIVLKSADMKDDMQKEAIDCAIGAFEKFEVEKDIAEHIKKEFDKNHGPTWHCIVGRNFGSIRLLLVNSELAEFECLHNTIYPISSLMLPFRSEKLRNYFSSHIEEVRNSGNG